MNCTEQERNILRSLAEKYALCCSEPINQERARLWTKTNELKRSRPVIFINELPWHEMNYQGELDLQCTSPLARKYEGTLRKALYLWNHLPGDMVLHPYLSCRKYIHNTKYGISEDVDIQRTASDSDIVSRHFKPQLVEEEDLKKIKPAVVTYDHEKTERDFQWAQNVFSDILPVRLVGVKHIWFTPWDNLIRWTGIEEAMMDLYDRPDFIHEAVRRIVYSDLEMLRQFVEMGLLDSDSDATRVGSGGYGFNESLTPVVGISDPSQNWGCSNAQIFSEVSPDMHWEFALQHDIPWLEKFGLNYYGCCEPLHNKIEILRRIPNLRKVSVSPWCKVDKIAEEMGNEVVLSVKPSPAIFASDKWNPRQARSDIQKLLAETQGCSVELVMKDVSTIRKDPNRLFEWAKIAKEEVERLA